IEQGLVNGYETNGKKYIRPMQKITRAETAKLLFAVIESEKITFDEEEKIIFDDTTEVNDDGVRIYPYYFDNKITLKWEEINNSNVKGYKVVASKYDDKPTYPEDGYYKFIQNDNDVDIIAYSTYNGDLKKLYPDTYYYFNVNVLYDDGTVIPSNTLKLKIPDNTDYDEDLSLEVEINDEGNGFELEWDEYEGGNLRYYKVVASPTVDNPKYPENGYYKYFTDPEDTKCTILLGEGYHGSAISSFKKDTEYNFKITVVKNDGSARAFTDTVSLIIPTIDDESFDLSGTINDNNDKFILNWDKYEGNNFESFKVVASIDDTPTYPENYYAEYTSNSDNNRIEIPLGNTFNNEGENNTFEVNQEYNFRISVIKNDGSEKTYSNIIKLEIVEETEITLTGEIVDNEFKLNWNEYIASDYNGYKVVASINDATPTYDDDGYYEYITDSSSNEITIPLDATYKNGDFDSFNANQEYNFAITVLKTDGHARTYSNTVKLEIVEETEIALTGAIVDNEFKLNWNEYIASDFDGYKVVASITDETPTYDDDGYYEYITDSSNNEITIPLDATYNDGDFDSFNANQEYNFAITVLKTDGHARTYSNTVKLEIVEEIVIPGNEITLTGAIVEGKFSLNWGEYVGSDFEGYKVVASINDDTPTYDDDGYYEYITDSSNNEITIPLNATYNDGDFTSFLANQEYNFAITVLKTNDHAKTNSNSIKLGIVQ
ncbi:hypothetical protein QUF55_08485, partial [Clostridiaceae bacterium HSG29]|nr:hypothetical protein [Clostridiaceae bacterium HSG29]